MSPSAVHGEEKQPDASTIVPATAWSFFIGFLERVGVDITTAGTADIRIDAGAAQGTVLVTGYAKDGEGRPIVDGKGANASFRTYFKEYPFCREGP